MLKFEKYMLRILVIILTGSIIACSSHNSGDEKDNSNSHDSDSTGIIDGEDTYKNPVFEPILADPSIIGDEGTFYAYGTEDDWGDGEGDRIVPIVRSKDLVNWKFVGEAFQSKPDWKSDGGIWAPAVTKIGDKYFMYYAYSIWADPNPGIGLAIADSPEGPFEDKGKLYTSEEAGVPNNIDPFFIEENDQKYLIAGSYGEGDNAGIYAFELSDDGKKVKDLSNKVKIAAGDFEAPMIYRKSDKYYFFGSKGNCCEGADSKYNVQIARSDSLLGPYKDKNGNPITERGNGTVFIEGNNIFVGPGHNADEIITDKEGTDWFLYHAIKKSNPTVSSGANRRSLMLDKINWDSSGWPKIEGHTPSIDEKPAPEL